MLLTLGSIAGLHSGVMSVNTLQEAAIMAIWLKGVTLSIANADPSNEHAATLGTVVSGTCVVQVASIRVRELGAHAGVPQQAPQHGHRGVQRELEEPGSCQLSLSCCAQPILGDKIVVCGPLSMFDILI